MSANELIRKKQMLNAIRDNNNTCCIVSKEQVLELHKEVRAKDFVSKTKNVVGYASVPGDLVTLGRVLNDLGIKGRYYEKTVRGKTYVILKGNQATRQWFTGSRYLAKNAKVVDMAIGKAAIQNSVRSGARFTVYLSVPIVILEHILKDETIMSDLFADLAMTLVKVGIASVVAAVAATAMGTVTTVAVAPLAFAVFVGIAAGYTLDMLDNELAITKKLGKVLRDIEDNTVGEISRGFHELERRLRWQIANGIGPGKGVFYP